MVKHVTLPIAVDDEREELCGTECTFLDQQSAGKEWCLAFSAYVAHGWNDRATRTAACLSATVRAEQRKEGPGDG